MVRFFISDARATRSSHDCRSHAISFPLLLFVLVCDKPFIITSTIRTSIDGLLQHLVVACLQKSLVCSLVPGDDSLLLHEDGSLLLAVSFLMKSSMDAVDGLMYVVEASAYIGEGISQLIMMGDDPVVSLLLGDDGIAKVADKLVADGRFTFDDTIDGIMMCDDGVRCCPLLYDTLLQVLLEYDFHL